MFVIVFDITNKESFGHVKFWQEKLKEMFSQNKKMIGKFSNYFTFSSVI